MINHSDDLCKQETIEIIDKFLNDFSHNDSFDKILKLKLQISRLYLSGVHTTEIRKCKILHQRHPFGSDEEKFLSQCLKPDCKKLYRIRDNSTPEGIIKMIQLRNICTYIIQKYPSPELIGFPYNSWTPNRLKKYICMYFGIKGKQINEKTINNILSSLYKSGKTKSKKEVVIESDSKCYYLYIKIHKFNKNLSQGTRKYNRLIYAALLQLSGTDFSYENQYKARLYFAHKKTRRYNHNPPFLYEILNQLLSDDEKNFKTIIYIEDSSLETFRNLSFHSLKALPKYRFILFDFESLQNITKGKKISGKNIDNNLKALESVKNLTQELNQICFSNPSEKTQFIDDMSKKIKAVCGDY